MFPGFARVVRRSALVLGLAAAAVMSTAAPASAHSLDSAVVSEAGCGWSNGNYTVLHSDAIEVDLPGHAYERMGTVYLLWNAQYGENCVVALRTGDAHGVASDTQALLAVQAGSTVVRHRDGGDYAHYAAASGPAANQCVRYEALIQSPFTGVWTYGGRPTWGNCG
ncbi:hypothetical protein NI17_022125 [Thermobifida halotolerans]|uniref:Uncharacterized protein n=1 Tax=Thermobifida halotolerans TaxID=483545 RepID=A0A399FYI4_9ACTN|nr:hypothetical protein [Thermobifida halotolerans]UOE19388.1 hypothetical protein NI17_022125 [Thermobifida halotolerans]